MVENRFRRLLTGPGSGPPLLPYLTAGILDPEATIEVFQAMADAGAGGFEIGIPYSDPLMDGPVIQRAAARALRRGMTLEGGLDCAARVATATERPVAVMSYMNPILALGIDTFAEAAAAGGVSAVIVADLPVDEAAPLAGALAERDVGMVLFVAPTTDDDRLAAVAAADPVFVYAVAEMGVTGERVDSAGHLPSLVRRFREAGPQPIVAGVGVSTPRQAAAAGAVADGVIVGSALVRRVLDAADPPAASAAAVRELAAAVRAGYRGRDSNPHGR